jgi:hypothetical protein
MLPEMAHHTGRAGGDRSAGSEVGLRPIPLILASGVTERQEYLASLCVVKLTRHIPHPVGQDLTQAPHPNEAPVFHCPLWRSELGSKRDDPTLARNRRSPMMSTEAEQNLVRIH